MLAQKGLVVHDSDIVKGNKHVKMDSMEGDVNSTTHISGDTRRRGSPMPSEFNDTTSYKDPFSEEESKIARKRSDSTKRARPLSTAEDDTLLSGARPPSFIEVEAPVKPKHKELFSKDEMGEGGKRKHIRRKSLESGQLLDDESNVQKPIKKAKSADDILDAVSADSANTTTKPDVTHDNEKNEAFHSRKDLVLEFPDEAHKTESPRISPVHGSTVPIQATDKTDTEYPYSVTERSPTFHHAVPRDEFEARMSAVEQEQQAMNQKLKELEKLEKLEIHIPNIEQSLKIAKDKKISAGFVLNSSPFYTGDSWGGYKLCTRVYINGDGRGKGEYLSVFLVVMKGDHDRAKEIVWPFNRKVTFILVNSTPGRDHENIVASISTGVKARAKDPAFQRPKNETNTPIGFPQFVSHKKLRSGGFIQNDGIVIRVVVETDCGEHLMELPEHCSEK